jgi:phage-related baseplate assembly protein
MNRNLRTLADLRATEPPQFFDTDPLSIKARLVATFEKETGKALFEGQPEMFMIETMAYALSVRAEAEQNAVLQNTIAWSQGEHLEFNAANISIFRLLSQKAKTTLRFTLVAASFLAVIIPAGTRLSDGEFIFATDEDLVIEPGQITADILASASIEGTSANGLAAYTINQPVDALPTGVTAHNLTETSGGSDLEPVERFRERAANGNFRISKGGPRNGYREIVKGLHPDIVDVGVIRPQPGHIDIYPLMKDGLPSPETKELVATGLDAEEDIPMGDAVTVKDLTPVIHDFTLIVRIDVADVLIEPAAIAIVEAVFEGWSQKAGVRISPSTITAEVRRLPGVVDAETNGLAFTDLTQFQFAQLGTLTVDVQVTADE